MAVGAAGPEGGPATWLGRVPAPACLPACAAGVCRVQAMQFASSLRSASALARHELCWHASASYLHTCLPGCVLPLPLQHLPKELRPAAKAAKKRATRVQERASAVSAALRLLRAHGDSKAAPKLCKALDALQKAKVSSSASCWSGTLGCGTIPCMAVTLCAGCSMAPACVLVRMVARGHRLT